MALARRGLAQDWYTTLKIANSAAALRRYAESARIYLPDGLPPVPPYQGTPGFRAQGALPDTLDRLSRYGLDDFYAGEIGSAIIKDVQEMGGILDAGDLRDCVAQVRRSAQVEWHGRTWQLAGGLTAAPTLAKLMATLGSEERGGAPDARWYAGLAAALKAAYADRFAALGEGRVDSEPTAAGTCTSHVTVCDAEGSMVAMTTTLLSSMGSRVVLPLSGVLMNNGVMWFDPRPGRPNSMASGKRPLTNMCPLIVRDGGVPVLAGGASGGRRILASVFQVASFVLDFGMSPDEAVRHPRIDVSNASRVTADGRLPEDVLDALRAGGAIEVAEHAVLPMNFACPNLITQAADGRLGATDLMSPASAALAQAS